MRMSFRACTQRPSASTPPRRRTDGAHGSRRLRRRPYARTSGVSTRSSARNHAWSSPVQILCHGHSFHAVVSTQSVRCRLARSTCLEGASPSSFNDLSLYNSLANIRLCREAPVNRQAGASDKGRAVKIGNTTRHQRGGRTSFPVSRPRMGCRRSRRRPTRAGPG